MIAPRYRPHLTALFALALPLIGSHLARMTIGVSDTVMIGRYGVDELAALVLATSMHFLLFMLGSGYAIGLMGVLAACLARRDDVEVRRNTRMTLWLSTLHAVLMLPALWFSGPLLEALGQEPQVAAMAQEYLRIFGFSMAPMLWGMTLNTYLATLGRARVVLWITVAGLPLNILLNWVLIFGNLGAPELGVQGAAIASLAVNLFQLAGVTAYALWLPKARIYRLAHNVWRPDWSAFFHVLRLGLPVGLTLVAETGMFAGANIMMGWFGPEALAAHGIAAQLSGLAFMFHLGLGNAATIRVGHAAGHRDRLSIRETAATVIGMSAALAVCSALLFISVPRALAGLYLDPAAPQTAAIVALTAQLMVWAALFQLVDALQAIALALLRGVQDTRAPMVIAAVAYWGCGLPAGYVAGIALGFGPQGIWFGLLLGLGVAAVLLLRRFWAGDTRGHWTRAGGPA